MCAPLPLENGSYRFSGDGPNGAWGEALNSSVDGVPGGFAYRFVGALGVRWDDGVGLHYMRQRWYDAGLARFLSRDSLKSVDEIYLYSSNRPVDFIDPLGMQSTSPSPPTFLPPTILQPNRPFDVPPIVTPPVEPPTILPLTKKYKATFTGHCICPKGTTPSSKPAEFEVVWSGMSPAPIWRKGRPKYSFEIHGSWLEAWILAKCYCKDECGKDVEGTWFTRWSNINDSQFLPEPSPTPPPTTPSPTSPIG